MKTIVTLLICCITLTGTLPLHAQLVTTFAGNGSAGSNNDTGIAASFNAPISVALDNNRNIYVTDADNNMIRKITPTGTVTTFAGATGPGITNDTGTAARFNHPLGIVIDAHNNVYVSDANNNVIRKITPAGVVSTFAGSGLLGNINGPDSMATFSYPNGLAIDDSGNIYVADANNNMIRKIDTAGNVSTLAGATIAGSTDDTGTAARFSYPTGLAIDKNGNIFVADDNNNMIRKINPAGVVTTYAGSTVAGSTDDTGSAASFSAPYGLAIDSTGNLYIAEIGNDIIRKITPARQVLTFAGFTGLASDIDGIGENATFNNPTGVALDGIGNIFVGDWKNNLIRKIDISYTGIFTPHTPGNVLLYPNPASDNINIPAKAGDQIIIYNLMGAKVYQAAAIGAITVTSVKEFPAGSYFVQVLAKDGSRAYGKFVKE